MVRGGGSIRVRTTLAAVLVVGAGLATAAGALVLTNRHALETEIRDSAAQYATSIAGQLDGGTRPESLVLGDDDETLVQIVAADGSVLRASPALEGRPRLADLHPGDTASIGKPTADDHFAAAAAATRDGGVVLVARSDDVVAESNRAVLLMLAAAMPVLGVLVGVTTWQVVGRTLRPVERIRREVDAVGSTDLHRRVSAPERDDEIAGLVATTNRMLERLEDGQFRLRRFVSDASHELRSPVAAIRQHAEVAQAHPASVTVPQLADEVHSEALRLQHLVEDLLLLARLDETTVPIHRAVDLDDLVFAEAERLRSVGVVRVVTEAVGAGRVEGEAEALRRALSNLGDNAAHHARSTVAFGLRVEGAEVVAVVEDDGVGIPATERERVFDRFVRLDGARARDTGGAGLGLAIVAGVAAAHGGSVRVGESTLGGARFEVRIPARPFRG